MQVKIVIRHYFTVPLAGPRASYGIYFQSYDYTFSVNNRKPNQYVKLLKNQYFAAYYTVNIINISLYIYGGFPSAVLNRYID
jgi:hypothetical protein